MNSLLVTGILCVFAASCDAAPPCLDVMGTVEKCLQDNGLNMTLINKLMTNGFIVSAEDMRLQCTQYSQYESAMHCIIDEFNRCSLGDGFISYTSFDQLSQGMSVVCNDTKIKFECLAQLSVEQASFITCVTSMDSSNDPLDKVTCDRLKIAAKCAGDIIRKCDDHTATIYEQVIKMGSPVPCSDSVVG